MSPTVAILVFLSALLHVGWNTLGKSGTPSKAFFFTASFTSVFLLLHVLFFADFDFSIFSEVWIYLAVSGLFQAVYYSGLAGAYRTGEMSLVYPLARALPVLFVPGFSFLIGNISGLSVFTVGGMFLVFLGCLILPQSNIRQLSFRGYFKTYSGFAVIAAFGTTGYTLLDSKGMEIIQNINNQSIMGAIFYFTFQMIFVCIYLGIFILFSSNEKRNLLHIIKKEKLSTIFAGLLVATAYIIILICYPMVTNVSYVTAFRQISIPLGAVAGILLLKEKWSIPKITGVLIIFIGLIIVYL
ncbi:MAG: hypothetical protein PF693_21210 [Spirochaetia bacterium]|jgi:uncharacterized membrane protein|nr:hypothetical protein [Spirochaetia bacterium]